MVSYVLDQIEEGNLTGEEMSKTINIKQAILWIALAWRRVKPQTIRNYFAKAFGRVSLIDRQTDSEKVYDSLTTMRQKYLKDY